jgi:hypothetical protein
MVMEQTDSVVARSTGPCEITSGTFLAPWVEIGVKEANFTPSINPLSSTVQHAM